MVIVNCTEFPTFADLNKKYRSMASALKQAVMKKADWKKEAKASLKFEKGPLNSKSAAKTAAGWVLRRFDLADENHAALAKQLGVTAAPTLLYYAVGAEAPVALDGRTSGAALAAVLKKHQASSEE